MSKDDATPEPKASAMLPPDGPMPVRAEAVTAAHDDLLPEVETRKIGIRRVSTLEFGNRMFDRVRRRAAGNSRRFWRQIEADDPFLKAPLRPTDANLEIYPGQRIARVEGSMPKPQPDVARAYPPPSRADDAPPPRPRTEAKPRPKPKAPPEPVHTPEPRPAPPPRAREPEPEPQPPRMPEPEPVPVPRRLPPKPANTPRSKSGRTRMPSRGRQTPPPQKPPQRRKTAKEIRDEKMALRSEEEEIPKEHVRKSLDQYREMLQTLQFLEQKHERGEEIHITEDDDILPHVSAKPDKLPKRKNPSPQPRTPKPKQEVKRERKAQTPPKTRVKSPNSSATTPAKAPVDRTPPKPKSTKKPAAPIDRSLKKGGNGGGMDDIFGGGGGDRVRIGRRSKPTSKPDGDDS